MFRDIETLVEFEGHDVK